MRVKDRRLQQPFLDTGMKGSAFTPSSGERERERERRSKKRMLQVLAESELLDSRGKEPQRERVIASPRVAR